MSFHVTKVLDYFGTFFTFVRKIYMENVIESIQIWYHIKAYYMYFNINQKYFDKISPRFLFPMWGQLACIPT